MKGLATISAILVSMGAALLTGCHVGGPAEEDHGVHAAEGKILTLRREVVLAHTGIISRSLTAFEVKDEEKLISRKQFERRLPVGTEIRISRIVSKRMEPGIFHSYECETVGSSLEFLLPFSMRDSAGLSKYTKWP